MCTLCQISLRKEKIKLYRGTDKKINVQFMVWLRSSLYVNKIIVLMVIFVDMSPTHTIIVNTFYMEGIVLRKHFEIILIGNCIHSNTK